MLRSNLGLLSGGCAAVAVGVVGGWTALALRAPALQQPVEAASSQISGVRGPAAAAPDAGTPAQPPTPPIAAPAPPAPPTPTRNAAASGPTGIWIDNTGRGAVEITECSGGLCGRIVWLKDASHKGVCGMQVIGNAKRTSSGTWDGGWIYDPDEQARYSVELKPIGPDRLRVVGYMGSKLFSETFTWKRPTTDLKRCDAPEPTATPLPSAGDPKPAPTEITKAQPAPDQPTEGPTASKNPKSGTPSIAEVEKLARDMIKRKPGAKECTAKLPYVGDIAVPCPG